MIYLDTKVKFQLSDIKISKNLPPSSEIVNIFSELKKSKLWQSLPGNVDLNCWRQTNITLSPARYNWFKAIHTWHTRVLSYWTYWGTFKLMSYYSCSRFKCLNWISGLFLVLIHFLYSQSMTWTHLLQKEIVNYYLKGFKIHILCNFALKTAKKPHFLK